MKLVFLVSDEMKVFHGSRGKKKKQCEVLFSLQGTRNLLIQSKSDQKFNLNQPLLFCLCQSWT